MAAAAKCRAGRSDGTAGHQRQANGRNNGLPINHGREAVPPWPAPLRRNPVGPGVGRKEAWAPQGLGRLLGSAYLGAPTWGRRTTAPYVRPRAWGAYLGAPNYRAASIHERPRQADGKGIFPAAGRPERIAAIY